MNELRLKEYRTNAKMSQRDVADSLNISQGHYWKWEVGRTLPDAKQILQLCDVFKCTPNNLFGIKEIRKTINAR